jgi:hypothetical protein
MNANLKCKVVLHFLQLANKLKHSTTFDNESLDQKWNSLVQLHGGVQACVELLRSRKLYINELILFMETISSMSCSIPEKNGEKHFINKPTDSPCTSTRNIQNSDIAISLLEKCAEKPQDEGIAKLDAPSRKKK